MRIGTLLVGTAVAAAWAPMRAVLPRATGPAQSARHTLAARAPRTRILSTASAALELPSAEWVLDAEPLPPIPPPRRWLRRCATLAAVASAAAAAALFARSRPALLRLGTIPLIAGTLNLSTNWLAIKMMFYPLRFVGLGPIGWHGIVARKKEVMAGKIVDDVMLRLIDLREVFLRLPAEKVAAALDPTIRAVAADLAAELKARKSLGSSLASTGLSSRALDGAVVAQGRELVAAVVRDIQADPAAVFSLRDIVLRGIATDPRVLVDLFEKCGAEDLRFVVRSGFWLGGALGVLQAALWAVWNPWWSLALSGALVGMVTDQIALKAIFEPVQPVRVGRWTVHGLFLRRQEQVSDEFSDFMASRVLSAPQLWDEILNGANRQSLRDLVTRRVDSFANDRAGAARALLGDAEWKWLRRELAERLFAALPDAAPALYEITDDSLRLRELMKERMRQLSCEEFERVLHPIFEEDEITLIAVGTALGGVVGAMQAGAF